MVLLFASSARVRALLAVGLLALPALAQSPENSMTLTMPRLKTIPASAAPLALTVTQARVVAVPPGISDTSVFLTLKNPGAQPVVLTAARSSVAAHAMLMQTVKDARGLTGMTATPSLTVPAHGTLVLDDLGPHVMLMGLKRALKPGEVVTMILSDRAGRTLSVRATVRKP
jgi:copper(I)-binding protein